MTKRSKTTLFGLLALIAAFGLILTGCPDPNSSESSNSGNNNPPLPTEITLATGSHGTAGSESITELTAAGVYVILDTLTGRWYGVLEDGRLGAGPTLTAATAEAEALGEDEDGEDITTIADPLLVNGRTYSVYAYDSTAISNAGDIDDSITEGKNTIINGSVLGTNAYSIDFVAGVGNNSSIVIHTGATNVMKKNEQKIVSFAGTPTQKVRGAANTFTYTITATAGSAVIKASRVGDDALVLTGITDTFAGTITSGTQPAAVTKGTKSQGSAAGDDSITGLTAGAMYALTDGTNWYGVKDDGSLGEARANPSLAAADAVALDGVTKITGLINESGLTYDAYKVSPPLADATNIKPDTDGFITNTKHVILNLRELIAAQKVTVVTGSFAADVKVVVLVPTALETVSNANMAQSGYVEAKGSGGLEVQFNSSLTVGSTVSTIDATEDDTWFTITSNDNWYGIIDMKQD